MICKICGKEFEAKNGQQLYCSSDCVRKADTIRKKTLYTKRNYSPKECGVCGKTFTPYHNGNLYCSPECKKKAKNKSQNIQRAFYRKPSFNITTTTINCLGCGKPFDSVGKHNRMCNHCRGEGEYISPHTISAYDLRAA